MDMNELDELLKEAATPIDFDALVQAGVLEKRGGWYAILDFDALPRHAKSKIKSVRTGKEKEMLVKFRAVSKQTKKLFKSRTASKTQN